MEVLSPGSASLPAGTVPSVGRSALRAAVGGLVLGIGLLAALVFGFPEAQAQRQAGQLVNHQPGHAAASVQQAGSPDMLALSAEVEGRQQITVIDPKQKVMAVYHIDRTTGAVSLRSVRNLQWDMQIEDFNSANPTPREIRALTQQQR